jgi:hypothetical protein
LSLSEANTYVAANPLRSGRRNRTKESIDTVCHRHLDSDIGESDLNSLPASGTVPTSTAILSTSPGKYPILWRVVGFTFTHRESTLKLRTIVFRQLSRLHRLQPDSPPARIAELRVRSGVSIYRRTPLRFHLESRWPSVGYFSNEHHAFASRNPIAKASR